MSKRMFLSAVLTIATYTMASAQDLKDNFYVKVLHKELQRNIERLYLPELEKPFFISYSLRNQYALTLTGERGEITSFIKTPVNNKFAIVKLRVGDYHRNFDYMMYDGRTLNLPEENNEDEFRRLLWLETDHVYKSVSRNYSNYQSSLKRLNVDAEELAIHDLATIQPIVKDFGAAAPIAVDTKEWEDNLKKLSAIFNVHKNIINSGCRLNVVSFEDYSVSSEGAMIRRPQAFVSFSAYGTSFGSDGSSFSSEYSITAKTLKELPSLEELQSQVKTLIDKIARQENAEAFEKSYIGPVLFVGNAVNDLIGQCFGSTIQVGRKSVLSAYTSGTNYEDKLGQKLISSELTLTAVPSLKTFKGKSATGYFPIDYEGVVPPDSLVLIEKGILKTLLNGRTLASITQNLRVLHNRLWAGSTMQVCLNSLPGRQVRQTQ